MDLEMQPDNHLRSELYVALLGKIISGAFAAGQRLVEVELARAFQVSRTPVREALVALAKDGLVERTRNCGAKVISFTPDDVEDIYEIRKTLECLCIRRSVRVLPLNNLVDLERRLAALNRAKGRHWNQKQAELDLELHRLIMSHSGNRRLIAYLENISLLINSLRSIGYRNDAQAREAGREHLAIVHALLRRNAEDAERLMAAHIETSKRNALGLFFKNAAEAGTSGRTRSPKGGDAPERDVA